MNDLVIRLRNGTSIVAPRSLAAITTYVLLEQETWFEKELGFVERLLQPGMHAIDVGANLGVFSLAMAKAVGPAGRVTGFEPASETRDRLLRSRETNRAAHFEIVDAALSDSERVGHLVFGRSSELNHLGATADGAGEKVRISSLDVEAQRHGLPAPYLIKIDAEGEEIPILAGARTLLGKAEPVLMLELKSDTAVNDDLIDTTERSGFRAYCYVSALDALVPLDRANLDPMELNFFAVTDRRAAELEARGLLVRDDPKVEIRPADMANALAELRKQPFAPGFPPQFAADLSVHPQYAEALGAYALWRDRSRPLAHRWAALRLAYSRLRALCDTDGRIGRLSTLARMAGELGRRLIGCRILEIVLREGNSGRLAIGEPFWPAAPRFDTVPQAGRPAEWFLAAACEGLEEGRTLSTAFDPAGDTLAWLVGSGFASADMHRRHCLSMLLAGRTPPIPDVLLVEAPDHLNAALWRDGTVTGLAKF